MSLYGWQCSLFYRFLHHSAFCFARIVMKEEAEIMIILPKQVNNISNHDENLKKKAIISNSLNFYFIIQILYIVFCSLRCFSFLLLFDKSTTKKMVTVSSVFANWHPFNERSSTTTEILGGSFWK